MALYEIPVKSGDPIYYHDRRGVRKTAVAQVRILDKVVLIETAKGIHLDASAEGRDWWADEASAREAFAGVEAPF